LTPFYGGFAIFGQDVTFDWQTNPRAEQRDAFFGLQGYERKDGGFRGRVALVSGTLVGSSLVLLNVQEATLESYMDGVSRVLTDTAGVNYPSMKLVRFFRMNPIMRDWSTGNWLRKYRAEFESPL
jgi:hypothetical protein